jgi:hypothetical protein
VRPDCGAVLVPYVQRPTRAGYDPVTNAEDAESAEIRRSIICSDDDANDGNYVI